MYFPSTFKFSRQYEVRGWDFATLERELSPEQLADFRYVVLEACRRSLLADGVDAAMFRESIVVFSHDEASDGRERWVYDVYLSSGLCGFGDVIYVRHVVLIEESMDQIEYTYAFDYLRPVSNGGRWN